MGEWEGHTIGVVWFVVSAREIVCRVEHSVMTNWFGGAGHVHVMHIFFTVHIPLDSGRFCIKRFVFSTFASKSKI